MLNNQLGKEIRKQRADPEFLLFLMGWTGFIHSKVVDFVVEKYRETYLKKIKRKATKDGGKFFWEEIKRKCLKPRLKIQLQKNLFKMEPLAPNPPNRPKNYSLWLTVYYFREYFKRITKKPQMRLIAEILFPSKIYSELNSEWSKRRTWFKGDEFVVPIDDLLKFYNANKETILGALRTGIPIYKKYLT
jgi:hypothetical protein